MIFYYLKLIAEDLTNNENKNIYYENLHNITAARVYN